MTGHETGGDLLSGNRAIIIVHTPHGNYSIMCQHCGARFGDYVGDAPVRALYASMVGHWRARCCYPRNNSTPAPDKGTP